MEEVLDIYKQAYDPKHPVICMDESSKQLIKETRQPLPMKPGEVEKFDTEYERNGTASIFMAFEPLQGLRYTKITEQRTRTDWAYYTQTISKVGFGQRESFRNLPILSDLIFLILGHLRSANFGALAQPKIQLLKLFGYT